MRGLHAVNEFSTLCIDFSLITRRDHSKMLTLLQQAHPQWHPLLEEALRQMNPDYLQTLEKQSDWLPGLPCIFAAFSMPLQNLRYLLFGESPYPRPQSANGYAFWDNAVGDIWSAQGFSKPVNRATSLRNWLKMLLVARGDLTHDLSQAAIAQLSKTHLCKTAADFFNHLINQGFLLLNASLVYREGEISLHARQWRPFMQMLLSLLAKHKPGLQLILFGKIAQVLDCPPELARLIAEHPYNLSFIQNPNVLNFFRPLDLLNCPHKNIRAALK